MVHSLALFAALAANAAEPASAEIKLPPKLEFKRVVSEWSGLVSLDGTLYATGDPSGVNIWKFGETRPHAHITWPLNAAQYGEVLPRAISKDNRRVLISRKKDNKTFELAVADIESESILGALPPRTLRCPPPGFNGIAYCERYGLAYLSDDGEKASYRAIFQVGNDVNGAENIAFTADGRTMETKSWRTQWINSNWFDEKGEEHNICFRSAAGLHRAFDVRVDAGSCAVLQCDTRKRTTYLDDCDAAKAREVTMTSDNARVYAEGTTKDFYQNVTIWDAATGKIIRTFEFRNDPPYRPSTWGDKYRLDVNARYLVYKQDIYTDQKVKAIRLDLFSVDTGERLGRVESSVDEDASLRTVANDGSVAYMYVSGKDDRGVMSLWRFGPSRGTPASIPAAPAQAAAPAVDVDQAPKSAIKTDPNAYAIVIGVEKYRSASIPAVDFAANDAKAMYNHLTQSMGFDAKNVVMLSNGEATKTDFEKSFGKWLLNRVDAKSRVFVYYAGHGAPNPTTGAGYLMPFEADASYLDETAYPVSRLYSELAKLPTKNVTVVLDACFSGQGQRSLIAAGTRPLVAVKQAKAPAGLLVIAAANGTQISASDPVAKHGLLTYHLLAGLKGAADANKDGRITAGEAFSYAKPAVERAARLQNVEQTPTLSGTADEAGPSWIVLEQ